jgi:hypothetical protein
MQIIFTHFIYIYIWLFYSDINVCHIAEVYRIYIYLFIYLFILWCCEFAVPATWESYVGGLWTETMNKTWDPTET